MSGNVRRWAAGVGLASGAAVAAAMIGTAGAPRAHADDGSIPADIGLLNSAVSNVLEGFAAGGHTETVFPDVISKLETIQTPLLSSDNSFVSGFGEVLFNGPDQQLEQASETFLSAAQALAAEPTNFSALSDFASAGFQLDSALFGEIPSTLVGKLTDQIFDIGGFDSWSASAATDLAASAASASSTPDDVIGQAINVINQGGTVMDTASTTDLSTRAAEVLSNQEALPSQLDAGVAGFATLQDTLSPTDQTLLGYFDEAMLSAAQNVLSADQAFVAADQAGDLSSNSLLPVEWTVLGADLQLFGSVIETGGASLFAAFTGGLDVSSAAAVDPSIFADLLSSIGL